MLLSILFFTCATAKHLKCWVSFGLTCKVVNQDLTDVDNVTFDVGELDEQIDEFMTVSLVETKLKDVPNGIFSFFTEAKEFVLSENELKQWKPEYLKGATKLTYLLVTQNSLENLPANAFVESPNLQLLELTENKIATIAPGAFSGLNHLTELRLNVNQFGPDLRTDTLSEVADTLTILNLADNKLEKIPEGFFKKLSKLQELTIYYNEKIKEVEGDIFPESLKKIIGREF